MISSASSVPSPGSRVSARRGRRRFSVDYKTAIVEEAERARAASDISALLRWEHLYSSHLTAWRKQHRAGVRHSARGAPWAGIA